MKKNTTKNMKNENVPTGTQNETKGFSFYDEVKKSDDAQIEVGKRLITDICMTVSNDYTVIDTLLELLELFTLKESKVSTMDLAEQLQDYLFRWTKEYGNAVDAWKDSVLYGEKYKTPGTTDTPDESTELEKLAVQISAVMKNPRIPTRLYNVMTDELSENTLDTDSPEWILGNLKKWEAQNEN
jgi:hypothetical protein